MPLLLPAPFKALLPTPRQRAALLLVCVVLLAHALLLRAVPAAPGLARPGEPVRVVQLGRVEPAAALSEAPRQQPQRPQQPQQPEDPQQQQRRPPQPPRLDVAVTAVTAEVVPAPAAVAIVDQSMRPTERHTVAAQMDGGMDGTAAIDSQPPPDGVTVPLYATRLPPAVTLRYDLRRGAQQGAAELQWAPAVDGSYRLQLQFQPPSRPQQRPAEHEASVRSTTQAWDSAGAVNATGIAPERHTESRRGRAVRAVNFQQDSGRITFSGPQTEAAWLPGTQDRLSWMLQLPAVLAANPALATPGSQVLLFVAGTRGDAEVWTFDVLGMEDVALPDGGSAPGLHLQRLPRRPYDTAADVWLDPARHHLPLRLTLWPRGGNVGAGGTDLVLRELRLP